MGWLVTKNAVFRDPPGDLVQSFIDSGLMVMMHDDILTVDTEVNCWRPVWWWTATSYSLTMSLILLKRTVKSCRCLFRFRSVLPESTKLQIIQSIWITSHVYKTVLKCIFIISNNKSQTISGFSRADIDHIKKTKPVLCFQLEVIQSYLCTSEGCISLA